MVSANVKPVEEWRVGEHVTCPRCGRVGKVAISTFRAKGKEYTYWVVNHPDKKKCVIERVGGPKAEAKAAPITAFTKVPEEEVPAQVPEAVEAGPAQVPVFKEWGPIPSEVDRAAWYSTKIAASWGSVRENPTEENFRYFTNTARQIAVRVGVPVEDAIAAVEAYVKTRAEQAKIRANEAVKFVIARVITASTPEIASFAEEVRKRVEEAVRKIEEVSKVPEVRVSEMEYAVMYAVYREKKTEKKREVAEKYGVPYGDMGEIARKAWERVFAPGRKIVVVEGQPA
jgi:hypothetical protein